MAARARYARAIFDDERRDVVVAVLTYIVSQ